MDDSEEDQIYNPNCSEKICNIELKNNNQILVPYSEDELIDKILKKIINNKEFKKIYPLRNYSFNCKILLDLFDLHLCLYKDIKEDLENKISLQLKLDDLHRLGILKNYKKPFFYLTENKMPLFINKNNNYKETYKNINEKKNFYYLYKNFLPRVNTLNLLLFNPQIVLFNKYNKNNYNKFTKFFTNPLICENEKLDWFIYDNESINFLIEMKKKKIDIKSKLKYINNEIYFIDKNEDKNDLLYFN